MSQPKKINLDEKFQTFNDYWSPKIVANVNDSQIKVAKFKGEFNWHHHENEDELFMVIKGELTIQFRDKNITARSGEMILIPKKVEHCPLAKEEVWVILMEPNTTLNTGNVRTDKTVEKLEEI